MSCGRFLSSFPFSCLPTIFSSHPCHHTFHTTYTIITTLFHTQKQLLKDVKGEGRRAEGMKDKEEHKRRKGGMEEKERVKLQEKSKDIEGWFERREEWKERGRREE